MAQPRAEGIAEGPHNDTGEACAQDGRNSSACTPRLKHRLLGSAKPLDIGLRNSRNGTSTIGVTEDQSITTACR